jgi:hypothetical protein
VTVDAWVILGALVLILVAGFLGNRGGDRDG